MFDDGDEKTLRRSSLCLKGARHFAESEVSVVIFCPLIPASSLSILSKVFIQVFSLLSVPQSNYSVHYKMQHMNGNISVSTVSGMVGTVYLGSDLPCLPDQFLDFSLCFTETVALMPFAVVSSADTRQTPSHQP